MGEEGLLNMEVFNKHKQGRVQTKPFGAGYKYNPLVHLNKMSTWV
jgi:hypothetical protein